MPRTMRVALVLRGPFDQVQRFDQSVTAHQRGPYVHLSELVRDFRNDPHTQTLQSLKFMDELMHRTPPSTLTLLHKGPIEARGDRHVLQLDASCEQLPTIEIAALSTRLKGVHVGCVATVVEDDVPIAHSVAACTNGRWTLQAMDYLPKDSW